MEMNDNKGQNDILGRVLGFVFLVIGVMQIALPVLFNAKNSSTVPLQATTTSILNSTEIILGLAVLVGGAVLIFSRGR